MSLATLASGTTVTPPSTAKVFSVTGVTAITTIASTNSWDGREITFVFAGILTLTHGANLALPGSANITTAANDVAVFVQTASGAWRCEFYQRADGSFATKGYLPLSGGTMTGAVTGITDLTTTGNTILGNAQGDTLNVAAGAIAVGTAGNVTIAPPGSGINLNLVQAAGSTTFNSTDGTVIARLTHSGTATTFGSQTNHPLNLETNSVTRIAVAAAGNVTIAPPGSGVGFTQTGLAGSDTAIFNGGTSGSFRVNTTGVPYGTSLHDNAGAVTGTTNQYICSGTYTPTLTTGSALLCQWIRVGNVVTVSGALTYARVTPGGTTIGISLPIASDITAIQSLGGTGANMTSAVPELAAICGDAANNRASFILSTASGSSQDWSLNFTYLIA